MSVIHIDTELKCIKTYSHPKYEPKEIYEEGKIYVIKDMFTQMKTGDTLYTVGNYIVDLEFIKEHFIINKEEEENNDDSKRR